MYIYTGLSNVDYKHSCSTFYSFAFWDGSISSQTAFVTRSYDYLLKPVVFSDNVCCRLSPSVHCAAAGASTAPHVSLHVASRPAAEPGAF